MAVVGTAVIDIVSNTAKFEAGVNRAEKQLGAFTSRAVAMAGVVTTAAAGALALLTKRSMENIDALAKQADMLNASTEALGAYKVQAGLAGVEPEKFANALRKMVTNLGDARDGTGEAAETLKRLGINIDEIVGLQADRQFEIIAEKINGMATQADKANAAARIFGERDGVKMLNLITEMGPKTAELRAQLAAMGVTFSRIDAAKVEAANDAMELAGQSAVGLGNSIAIAVSPFIEQMAKKWTEAAVSAGGFSTSVHKGMMFASIGIGIVADALRGLHVVLKTVELAAAQASAGWVLILEPFMNPEFVDASVENMRRVQSELEALVNAPMPSEGIRDGFFEIIEGADAAATAVAKAKEAAGRGFAVAPLDTGKAAEEAAKRAKQLEDDVNAAYARNIELITGKTSAALQYEATLTDLNELIARGRITQDEYNEAVKRAQDEFEKTGNSMSVFADQAARNMQSAFADFLFDPFKDGLKGMLLGFADTLRRMVAEAAAAKIFEAIGGAGGLGGFFASFFGGGRASGGPVSPGMMYEVNERTPEVLSSGGRDYLMTGAAGGRVSPLQAAGRAAPNITVHTTINAPGADPALLARLPGLLDERDRRLTREIFESIDRSYAPIS